MRHFHLLLPSLLAIFTWSGPARAQVPGRLHLVLSSGPTTSYQPNELAVTKVEGRKVTGKLTLQFDIGPQARLPMPWEKTHVLPFSAMLNPDTDRLEFTVEIPQGRQMLKMTFQGHFFPDGLFAGVYLVNGKARGAFYSKPLPKPAEGTFIKL